MTSWLIPVGLLVLYALCLWLFWRSEPSEVEQQRALCSQCDPEIGKWHGLFPREEDDGTRQVAWRDGEWLR